MRVSGREASFAVGGFFSLLTSVIFYATVLLKAPVTVRSPARLRPFSSSLTSSFRDDSDDRPRRPAAPTSTTAPRSSVAWRLRGGIRVFLNLVAGGLRIVLMSRGFTGMGNLAVSLYALFFFTGRRVALDFSFRAEIGCLVVSVFGTDFFSVSYGSYTFFVSFRRIRESNGVMRGREGRPI